MAAVGALAIAGAVAAEHAECPICCHPLYEQPLGYMVCGGGAAAAAATGGKRVPRVNVVIPPGSTPGSFLDVRVDAITVRVEIPAGTVPGQMLQIAVPPCAATAERQSRSCRHLFHDHCLREWGRVKGVDARCPCCSATFERVVRVPKFDDDHRAWCVLLRIARAVRARAALPPIAPRSPPPRLLAHLAAHDIPSPRFDAVDIDGDGTLDQTEVLEIMQAQFAIDYKQAAALVPKLWSQWDRDGNGSIDFDEMVHEEHGLVAYMRRHLRQARTEGGALGMVPDILRNRREWFFYFDDDRSGALERAEVERAFVITFSLGDPQKAATMREAVGAVWPIFDTDGSNSIEMDEFLEADGLADSICASLG